MARPREFDEDDVLEKALYVFWEKGFDSSTLADLEQATGLTKSSLYKAFESKEGLFRRVVDRYNNTHLSFCSKALEQPTPRRVAEALLDGMVNLHTGKKTPTGCLVTFTALACSVEARPLANELSESRNQFERSLRLRLDEIGHAGSLPAGMSAADVALFLTTFIQGLAIQARSGAPRRQLRHLVAVVMQGWPVDEL